MNNGAMNLRENLKVNFDYFEREEERGRGRNGTELVMELRERGGIRETV